MRFSLKNLKCIEQLTDRRHEGTIRLDVIRIFSYFYNKNLWPTYLSTVSFDSDVAAMFVAVAIHICNTFYMQCLISMDLMMKVTKFGATVAVAISVSACIIAGVLVKKLNYVCTFKFSHNMKSKRFQC
jgi:hypothetical protein